MSERIICAIGQNIVIFDDGKSRRISSKFIDQYCSNHEQILRKNAWKSEGFSAQFRMETSAMNAKEMDLILDSARVTGVAGAGTDEIIFSVSIGDSSGLFKRTINDPNNNSEGHIVHDRGRFFQDIAVSSDGRMAFSVRNNMGELNIAVAATGSPQYRELTEGDSIDRNPFWSPHDPDLLIFDSTPIAYKKNGAPVICPSSILCLDLKKSEIDVIMENENYDFINPQIDNDGNVWCIRRPYKMGHEHVSFFDLLLIPFKIGRAVFRAIEAFSIRNTGEPLTSSGSNPSKARPAPKDLMFDGRQIDAERNIMRNTKSGDFFPGYIPRNWELVQIDHDCRISVKAKSVCSFALLSSGAFVYSNGKFLLKSVDGKVSKIAEAIMPAKIVIA